jgi:hypothetical protein
VEGVPAALSGGYDDGTEGCEVLGGFEDSEGAGDSHPGLHYAQRLVGKVVGEGDGEGGEEAQGVVFEPAQSDEQVVPGASLGPTAIGGVTSVAFVQSAARDLSRTSMPVIRIRPIGLAYSARVQDDLSGRRKAGMAFVRKDEVKPSLAAPTHVDDLLPIRQKLARAGRKSSRQRPLSNRASTSRALQLNSASLKRIQRYAGFFERSANDSGRVSDVLSHEVAGPLRAVVLKRGKNLSVLLDRLAPARFREDRLIAGATQPSDEPSVNFHKRRVPRKSHDRNMQFVVVMKVFDPVLRQILLLDPHLQATELFQVWSKNPDRRQFRRHPLGAACRFEQVHDFSRVDSCATRAPRLGTSSTKLSEARTFSASRKGVREICNCRQRSLSLIHSPAAKRPSTIMSRRRSSASSCNGRRRIGVAIMISGPWRSCVASTWEVGEGINRKLL